MPPFFLREIFYQLITLGKKVSLHSQTPHSFEKTLFEFFLQERINLCFLKVPQQFTMLISRD